MWWIMNNGFVCDVLWMVDVYVMGYGCVCDGIWMCMWYIMCCVLIYMWFLCLCWWKAKNQKIAIFSSLPSAVTMTLDKAGKQRPNFPALPSARAMALGKDFFKKRKNFFAECKSMALGKEFSKKKEKILCRVPLRWHSAKRPSELTSDFFCRVLT